VERHGVVITYGDITARKRDVEKLRESEERFHAMFEKHDAVMLLIEPRTGAIHDANQSAIKFYGYPKPKLCKMNINDINTLSPEQVTLERQKALNEDRNYLIFRHKLANGEERSVEVHSSPIHFQDEPMLFSIIHDITARKKAEDEIQARLRLRQYAESLTLDELLQMTLDEAEALTGSQIGFAHFLEADQKTLDLQMWSTNTLKNMCSAEGKGQHYPIDQAGVWVDCIYARAPMIHNDYASLPHRKGMPPGHAPVTRELVVPVMQGNLIVAIFGVGNKPSDYTDDDVEAVLQLANLTWDIVLRKRAEEALKVSERKHRMLHESMIDGFVKIDMSGKIQEYNQVFRDMLGYSETELVCLTYVDITPEKWHAFELEIVENQIVKRGYSDIYEKEYRRKDGTIFPVELRVVLLRDEQDKLTGMWAIVRDITKRKQADDTLETAYAELKESLIREKQLAHTDMLTGVNNRRNLYAIAAHELDIAIRYQQPLSIMMFDLDQFKKVNDTFGHTVGDQVLVQVTQAACAELRSADAIGRYGGEEFVILLPVTSALQAYPLAERIRERVAAIRVPTPIGDAAVTLSIGIVEMVQTPTPGESLDDMIRRADQAMYAAKQAGRNCTVVFDGEGIRKKPD
jgi:diguanylate cyclase (GGDEF)-like protein/PAS domain S-box-containing protein